MRLKDGFSEEKNQAYIESETFLNLFSLRRLYVIFIALYAFFGITDIIFFPELWIYFWILRFGVVIPVLISTIIFSYQPNFIKMYQPYITSNFILGGIVIAIMLIIDPNNMVYYGGLFLVYFSGYLIARLRYVYALIGGWSIFLFHLIGTLIYHQTLPNAFLYSGLFLIGANILGMAGAYNLEKNTRAQFLKDLEIKKINEKLHLQNKKMVEQVDQLEQFIQENKELNYRFKEKDKLTKDLEATEKRFEELAAQSKTFVYEMDLDGKYTYVSKSVESILGYKVKDIAHKMYFYELFPKEVEDKYKEIGYKEMYKEGIVNDFVNPLQKKDGTVVWVNSYLGPVYNPAKKLIAYRGSDKDITKEYEALNKLKLFKSVLDKSNFGSVLLKLDGTIIYVNKAYCDMHGCEEPSLLIGKHYSILNRDDHLLKVGTLIDKMQTDGGFSNQKVWQKGSDNKTFPVMMTGRAIYIENEPTYLSLTFSSTTNAKMTKNTNAS